MSSSKTDIELLILLIKLIKKFGKNDLIRKFRELLLEETEEFKIDVFEYILTVTSNYYDVHKKDVLYSNKRGKITESRRMCYALMKEHLDISDEKIGEHFGGKSRQFVNREIKDLPINQDTYATKDEKKFVDNFLKLTRMVLIYKNSYKLNYNLKTKEQHG